MREWTIPSTGTAEFSFLLFDHFSNQVLSNALEPLRAANTFLGRAAYRWQLVTEDGKPVSSSSGMQVVPDADLSRDLRGAALVLLPSYGYRAVATPALSRKLRSARGRFDTLIGIDGGAWALAAAELLDGRRATIHGDEIDAFSETFPNVDVSRDRFVDDGDCITSGGAVAAFEMMLHLIARRHGTALTLRIASLFAVPDAALSGPVPTQSRDARVARAIAEMEANIETPLPLPAIASRAGSAQKDLERRFLRAFGAPPRKVYQRIRLNAARNLVETTALDITEIADRAGYANAASFTRAFRETFGTTPRAIRQT